MPEIIQDNIAAFMGAVAFILPIMAYFVPLKEFQFGLQKIYGGTAIILSLCAANYAFENRQNIHTLPQFQLWMILGIFVILASVIPGKMFRKRKPLWAILLGCALYSIGIGAIIFGITQVSIIRSYFELSGQVVVNTEGDDTPLQDAPIYLMTDISGVSFETKTSKSGHFSFLISPNDALHATRVDICQADNNSAFRILDFDNGTVTRNDDKKIHITPPIKVLKSFKCRD